MTTPRDTQATWATRLFLIIENRMLREVMAAIASKSGRNSPPSAPSAMTPMPTSKQPLLQCDILLADQASASAFPNNFIPDLLRLADGRKAVFFGMEEDSEAFLQAVRAGVNGAEDMIAAVRRVALGEAVCPPWLCHDLFQFVARISRESSMTLNQNLCRKLGLTTRQQ